jgi:hypothetical protein
VKGEGGDDLSPELGEEWLRGPQVHLRVRLFGGDEDGLSPAVHQALDRLLTVLGQEGVRSDTRDSSCAVDCWVDVCHREKGCGHFRK